MAKNIKYIVEYHLSKYRLLYLYEEISDILGITEEDAEQFINDYMKYNNKCNLFFKHEKADMEVPPFFMMLDICSGINAVYKNAYRDLDIALDEIAKTRKLGNIYRIDNQINWFYTPCGKFNTALDCIIDKHQKSVDDMYDNIMLRLISMCKQYKIYIGAVSELFEAIDKSLGLE